MEENSTFSSHTENGSYVSSTISSLFTTFHNPSDNFTSNSTTESFFTNSYHSTTIKKTLQQSTFLSTTTPTPPSEIFHHPEEWSTLQICYTIIPLALIILLIVLGNLLVIIAILSQKNLRTPSNIYILSLAITDLSVGLFILPLNINDMINGWEGGNTLCKIWLTSDVTLCSTSILHITAIAVDRFRSINEGLSYAMSRTTLSSVVNCGALWFLALWIASPPVLGWNDWNEAKITECRLSTKLGYIVHSATGAFFIPAIVMSGLYARIYFLLRKKFRERAEFNGLQNNQMEQLSSHDLDQDSTTTKCSKDTLDKGSKDDLDDAKKSSSKENLDDAKKSSSKENLDTEKKKVTVTKSKTLTWGKSFRSTRSDSLTSTSRKYSEQITGLMKKKIKYSLSKERRSARTLGILIGAFLICWTPFTMTYLVSGIVGIDNIPVLLFQGVTWLGYVNSGINPIIYNVYNEEFKRAFVKIVWFWKRTGSY